MPDSHRLGTNTFSSREFNTAMITIYITMAFSAYFLICCQDNAALACVPAEVKWILMLSLINNDIFKSTT